MSNTNPVSLAIAALVKRDDAALLFDSLEVVVRLVTKAGKPVALTGDAAVLNALVELSTRDAAAYESALALADKYRALAALPPLRAAEEGFSKTDYMRDFMAQSRQRQRRTALIENTARSEKDQLRGMARMEFCRLQARKWKLRLDTILATVRAAHGGVAPKDVVALARQNFWATVDGELDAAEARSKKRH